MGGCKVVKEEVKTAFILTSMKGWARIFKAKYQFTIWLWILATLAFLGVSIWQVVILVQDYLRYDTSTVIKEATLQDLMKGQTENFKGMTVTPINSFMLCNANPVPSTQNLNTVMNYTEYLSEVEQTLGPDTSTDQYGIIDVHDYYRSYSGYYDNVPKQNLTDVGISIDEFLIDCKYTILGKLGTFTLPCKDITKVTTYSHPSFFNCFIVELNMTNFKTDNVVPRAVSGVIYLDESVSHNVMSERTSAGAFISFPQVQQPPSLGDYLAIPPGFHNNIQLEYSFRSRQPEPYSDCHPTSNDIVYYDVLGNGYRHSLEACVWHCIYEYIADKCNCIDSKYAMFNSTTQGKDQLFCGDLSLENNDPNNLQCSLSSRGLATLECVPKCQVACNTQVTQSSLSALRWPTNFGREEAAFMKGKPWSQDYAALLNASTDKLLIEQAINKMERNFVKFTVTNYQDTFVIVTDQIVMTPNSLLSDIGGSINLFSGITTFVAIEAIDLLFSIIMSLIVKPQATKSPTKTAESSNL